VVFILDLQEILEELNQNHTKITLLNKAVEPNSLNHLSDREVKDVYFLTQSSERRNDLLYVILSSHLNTIGEDLSQLIILIIKDTPVEESMLKRLSESGCTLILLSSEENIFTIYNQVKTIFSKNEVNISKMNDLFQVLLAKDNIDDLLQVSEEFLQNPIIVIDESFKIIAHSTHIPLTDELWIKNIKNGFCSYEFIAEVNQLMEEKGPIENDIPFSINCDVSPVLKWVTKLTIDNRDVGYIIIPACHQEMYTSHKKMLSQLSKLVAYKLKREPFLNSIHDQQSEEKFLADLIRKNIHSRQELEERRKASGLTVPPSMRILLISHRKGATVQTVKRKRVVSGAESVEQKLLEILPDHLHTVHGNKLIYLLLGFEYTASVQKGSNGIPSQITNEKRIEEKLNQVLQKYQLKGIVSDSFSDLFIVPDMYDRMERVLEMEKNLKTIKKTDGLLELNELRFYQLIHDFPMKETLLQYCHPAVLKLKHHDSENGTEYYHTLLTYFFYNQNVFETAQHLFIHRNTLNNRLKKINELIDVDLTEGEVIFQIAYSYKLLSYLNGLKHKVADETTDTLHVPSLH